MSLQSITGGSLTMTSSGCSVRGKKGEKGRIVNGNSETVITINGKKYTIPAKAVVVFTDSDVTINDKTDAFPTQEHTMTISVQGTQIESVSIDSGTISVVGNVARASTSSGDIKVDGDVISANSMSGNIVAQLITNGSTMSGNIVRKSK